MTGEPIVKHLLGSGPSYNLGVKNVSVSPNQILMVNAYFDTKMKLFNCLTQKEIT